MRRNFYEVFRTIDQESEQLGIEIRWSGRASCPPNFELGRYHKRFLMLYIYDGICIYKDPDGQVLELGAGNLVLFKPYEYQNYRTHNERLLKYYGMSFSGHLLERMLEGKPMLDKTVHYIGVHDRLKVMMQDLIGEMLLIPLEQQEIIWGSFFKVIGEINSIILRMSGQEDENYLQVERLKKAEQYICLHYNEELKVRDIAEISGYSVSWFENLFRKQYHMSPINYQIKQRISKAEDMIRSNIYSISEISYAVGFNDPLYFSKVFKKHVGVSPKHFRNLHAKRPEQVVHP